MVTLCMGGVQTQLAASCAENLSCTPVMEVSPKKLRVDNGRIQGHMHAEACAVASSVQPCVGLLDFNVNVVLA